MSDLVNVSLPFRPRARLLQLLGDQLIGSPRLAVFELVKNAYDADAEQVTVTIEDLGTNDASITVEDDGEGMTIDTIKNIWLVPAHDHRELQRLAKKRTRLNRLPLGEKGVGRFAVHKLGDHIELITRAKNSDECVVKIDWSSLIEKGFLSDAKVTIRTRTPTVFKGRNTGTRIIISKLRENDWSRGDVRRLFRQITSISSPFEERSDRFEASLHVPDHPDWIKSVPDVETLLGRAPWKFTFSISADGKLNWTYEFRGIAAIKLPARTIKKRSETLLLSDVREDTAGLVRKGKGRVTADQAFLKGIGPVKGQFYIFDRDRAVLNKLGDSQLIQNYLDENGGIRVYRDGIRVYNYGEPGDDWLGLDLRRVNAPTRNISRNIIVGALDLSLEDSVLLKEKTNREGFIETDAYERFKRVVLGALGLAETERKIDKDSIRQLTTKGYDPEVERIQKPLEELRVAVRRHKLSNELEPLIDKVERDYAEMRDTMLRAGLSGMGLAVVFHEIEQGVRVLFNAIESGGNRDSIQTQARELVRILDGFTELLRKGDRQTHALNHLIKRARDLASPRFRIHNVRLVCPALEPGAPELSANFAYSLVLGAMTNIIDNAIFWLKARWPEETQKPSKRAIYIGIDTDLAPGSPAIVIADTGPGFQDDPERLVRPFFSRRPDGMGVGLYYSNMVMEINGGRLLFPDRDSVDLPEEFDGAILALIFDSPRKK
ncbi:ATP-binding protein [Bradyrhizobium sp. 190]|uniref:ATP-binding protein n=1 Tax=Bradyrhizobium sp. 190 TaxID=2782658 RepID=UPI001FF98AC9|nr:ATP-binding protein [Bradyrhizobium sp. 190]MCK1513035.1 ATP-binding protein [Bradyrhizobium sp. 190]